MEEREVKEFQAAARHTYAGVTGRILLKGQLKELGLFEEQSISNPENLMHQAVLRNFGIRILLDYLDLDIDGLYDRFINILELPPVGLAPGKRETIDE